MSFVSSEPVGGIVNTHIVRIQLRRLLAAASVAGMIAACNGDGSGPDGIRSVDVSAPSTVVIVGQSAQLTATARDASGSVVSGTVSWRSSAPTVASVNSTGLVSALNAGQPTITASMGGVSGSLTLTVMANPAGTATVSMPGFSFVPFTTTINVGGAVIYEFPAEAHNVIFNRITGAPADIQATNNRSVARTFLVAGTFPYDCTLHPGMSGTVVVR
jgi:plastocyanin